MLKKRTPKALLKPLAFSGAGLLVLTLVLWVSGNVIAHREAQKTDAISNQFLQQYPKVQKNDSARTLEKLAAELGIGSLSGEANSEVVDSLAPENTAALEALSAEMNDYLNAQAVKEQGPIDRLPETFQTYLNSNLATLNTVEAHLRSAAQPTWNFDAEAFANIEYAIPSFFGLVNLHKLLLLKAVNHAQQNQPEKMVTTLEAAQTLHATRFERPDLLNYLVSLMEMDSTIAIIRHLEGVPTTVSSQLLAVDYSQRSVESIQFDTWTMYKGLTKGLKSDQDLNDYFFAEESMAALPMLSFYRPYLTLSLTNAAHLQSASTEKVAAGMSYCTTEINNEASEIYESIPWWNLIAKSSMPSYLYQWQKGSVRALQSELAHHIVRAKALAAEQGQWPETLSDLDSQICPGEKWVYSVSPEGQMSLSFSHELDWRNQTDDAQKIRPLTYRSVLP